MTILAGAKAHGEQSDAGKLMIGLLPGRAQRRHKRHEWQHGDGP